MLGDNEVWNTRDANNCPFSGSVQGFGNNGVPMQSASIDGNVVYNFGASVTALTSNASFICDLYIFSDLSMSAIVSIGNAIKTPGVWQTEITTVVADSNASANVTCEIADTLIDDMFLTPSPGMY